MDRFCYLVEKIGPYHAARLEKTASTMSGEVIALEFAPQSRTYAWDVLGNHQTSFVRRTPSEAIGVQAVTRPAEAAALRRTLDECRPSVVFLNGWADRWAAWALDWCLRTGTPAVVMSDSQARDEPRRVWKEWIKRRFVRRCQAAFVAGRRHREYICALGLSEDRVVMGYDVVDNDHFWAGARAARAAATVTQAKLGLPPGRSYFLCVSRFVPKKNLPLLLRAFALYRQQHLAAVEESKVWDLVLLGDGEGRTELESQISSADLARHVHLRGFRQYDVLPGYYGLAGALVLASTSDQWGLTVNEAMAAGLPVLVSEACGCAPELVQSGTNGFAFNPGDEQQLASLLFDLASTPEAQLWRMGDASRNQISAWSLGRFADEMRRAAQLAQAAAPAHSFSLGRLFDRCLLQAMARFRPS